MGEKRNSKYSIILKSIFSEKYTEEMKEVAFSRTDISIHAKKLNIQVPKNIGDVVYSFRYRAKLPDVISKTAPSGKEWIIIGSGSAKYKFKLCNKSNIYPNPNMETIPIPDNTPEAILMYQLSDEQSLLCKIRYNRLLDVFLGIVTYSMQNHLRTQVKDVGQIEIDEIYIGVNKKGQHFIIPVEAKIGKDKIGVVQLMQDIEYCTQNFPNLICIPIAVHKMDDDSICIFKLKLDDEGAKVCEEKHYQLLHSSAIDLNDIANRNKEITD